MYINCPSCGRPINANYITYCEYCFAQNLKSCALFVPSGEKNIRSAEFNVKIDRRKGEVSDLGADSGSGGGGGPSIGLGERLKNLNMRLVGASAAFIVVVGLIIWRALPFMFPAQYVDKQKEIALNMLKAKEMVVSYQTKNKKLPDSLGTVVGESVVSLINPVNGFVGEGKSWADSGSLSGTPQPGIVVYKKVDKDNFEITAFDEKSQPYAKDGQPLVVNKSTSTEIVPQ